MATQRQNAEQLFEAALELRPEDRSAFLDQACGEDTELRRMVNELLLDHERAGSFLEKPLFHLTNEVDIAATNPRTGGSGSDQGDPGATSEGRFRSGEVLSDRFVIVRFIARGGMGEVYEVEDHHLQSVHIALKMILPQYSTDPSTQHRFEQEVLLARKVTHPNLCPIYDIFHCKEPAPPFSFLTMRLLTGETLAARLARSGALPPEEAKAVFKQMTAGLGAIHAAGVIHRDIKPNNVMLDGEGPNLSVCITDFGLARLHQSETTRFTGGTLAGTFGYMAPESLLGQPPTQATDIFAFGVVLHEVFTGERPQITSGSLLPTVSPRLKSASIPPEFTYFVTEFLSDDPKRRVLAFEQAQNLFDSKTSHRVFIPPVPTFWTRRRFAVTAAATTCAVIGGVRWKWDAIENMLHPLPLKRFVALLNWPPTADSYIKPMLSGVIDAIGSELARAEAFDRNLFVISRDVNPETKTPAQLNDIRDSLGANLVLATSGSAQSDKFNVFLRVLDPSSTRTLRETHVSSSLKEPISLPDRAVHAAERLLNVGEYQRGNPRTKQGTQSPEAFNAFQAAESLKKQENNKGLETSIEKYKQAIELDPHYALAHARLAFAYLTLYSKDHDPAAIDLARANSETALTLNPDLVEGHITQGFVFEMTGDKTDALREIAKALSLDPSNPRTLLYQAQFYARHNRLSDAETIFHRVLKERPNYWLAYNELGMNYYAQGKYQEALDSFRTASLAAPQNTQALTNAGVLCQLLGNFEEAENYLNKSLALGPSGEALATMASVKRSEGKYAEALQFALKATELAPTDSNNWLEVGDSYSLLHGHPNDAKKAYLRGAQVMDAQLRTDPTNGPNWMQLALFRLKSGSADTASALVKKAEALNAEDVDSQLTKVRILELLGDREGALETLTSCVKKGATKSQIQSIPDLEQLRSDPRYKGIFNSSFSTTGTN
jgi:eukaryotic-like serine/threonine-protein kinase